MFCKEISNIKEFVASSRACTFNEECVLEAKFGTVTLDIPKEASKVLLYFRRRSGDGVVIINETETIVASKLSWIFEIKDTTRIEIKRPKYSLGEISLFGITLYYDEAKEGEVLANNWKDTLARCGDYGGIRMINNRLFASPGAYIANSSIIQQIETIPSLVTKTIDDRLTFSVQCEIVSLEVNQQAPKIAPVQEPYRTIEAPVPLLAIKQEEPTQAQNNLIAQTAMPKMAPVRQTNQIIYDSMHSKEFNKAHLIKSPNVAYLKSNGQDFLVLRKDGSHTINLSFLDPGVDYIVKICGKKLSGNGCIKAGFTHSNQTLQESVSGVLENKDLYLKINSGNMPDENCDLVIQMAPNGTGEVMISKVQIIDGINGITGINDLNTIPKEYISQVSSISPDKNFVIVIPSYNNQKWCEKNITSALSQKYPNFRIIFIDDASADDTFARVEAIVESSTKSNRVTMVKNKVRQGALANLYNHIHSCDDDEVILTLDGDDWFPDEYVLNKLNDVYTRQNIWMTYGQYKNSTDGGNGVADQYPTDVINNNSFRSYRWCASHLRTFYAGLFKKINKEDFFYNGTFMSMTWDLAMMLPMLEMAGHHSCYISDILYVYNLENPINDHKVNVTLQQKLDRYVRSKPRYSRLKEADWVRKTKVGLLMIATGKYDKFLQGIISSADNYFLQECDVTYYVMTDKDPSLVSSRKIVRIPIQHREFPFATMDRFRHFTNAANKFSDEDFLFYVDVDCLFVDKVGTEILGELVGVQHCGFVNRNGPVETNPKSTSYIDLSKVKYRHYYAGGLSGGKRANYLEMARWCADALDKDVANGIIPIWHDESIINRYFIDHKPDKTLTPSYHYPQSEPAHYQKIWGEMRYKPKLLLLDKNHADIRKA